VPAGKRDDQNGAHRHNAKKASGDVKGIRYADVKKRTAALTRLKKKVSNIVLLQPCTLITIGDCRKNRGALTDVKHRVVFLSRGG